MISSDDIIFKFIPLGNNADGNTFSVFGNDENNKGNSSFAFESFALGYKNGADAIYDKFCESNGEWSILDTIVYPLCFLYRHMTEILIKYMYKELSKCSDDEFKRFLKNGSHNLIDLWKTTQPFIEQLRMRVKTSVSLDAIVHYIDEISKFDPTSYRMRYPVDKELRNTNEGIIRLDIHNLHSKMTDFYDSVIKFCNEIGHQIVVDIPKNEINRFINEFNDVRPLIPKLLRLREEYDSIDNDIHNKNLRRTGRLKQYRLLCYSNEPNPRNEYINFVKKLTCNNLIILQSVYYFLQDNYNLPEDETLRRNDFVKGCILKMRELGFHYNTKITNDILFDKDIFCLRQKYQNALDIMTN